jgi:hypothetical protein
MGFLGPVYATKLDQPDVLSWAGQNPLEFLNLLFSMITNRREYLVAVVLLAPYPCYSYRIPVSGASLMQRTGYQLWDPVVSVSQLANLSDICHSWAFLSDFLSLKQAPPSLSETAPLSLNYAR